MNKKKLRLTLDMFCNPVSFAIFLSKFCPLYYVYFGLLKLKNIFYFGLKKKIDNRSLGQILPYYVYYGYFGYYAFFRHPLSANITSKSKLSYFVLSKIRSSYFCMKNILILIFGGLLDTSIRVCHQILCWSHSDGHDFGSSCHVLLKIVRPILMRHNIRLSYF